jgi:hypothetical protein
MGQGFMRRPGAKAKVCLLFAVLLGVLVSTNARAAPFILSETESEPGVVVYAAQTPGEHRVTVLLHGMCGEPQNACRHFAPQITAYEHLICPRASRRCDGGGSTWAQGGFEQKIEQAVSARRRRWAAWSTRVRGGLLSATRWARIGRSSWHSTAPESTRA